MFTTLEQVFKGAAMAEAGVKEVELEPITRIHASVSCEAASQLYHLTMIL